MPFTLSASQSSRLAPKSYQEIKEMVTKYHSAMNLISTHLKKDLTLPQIVVEKEPLGFYIRRKDLESIIAIISQIDKFDRYIALFGIENGGNENLTLCLVGADEDGKILETYKDDESTLGHEKWPLKTSITLASTSAELYDFLNTK